MIEFQIFSNVDFINLAVSVLRTKTEIHAFETGILFMAVAAIIERMSLNYIGGIFLGVSVLAALFISPIPAVVQKPWYFLSGVVTLWCIIEVMRNLYTLTLYKEQVYSKLYRL